MPVVKKPVSAKKVPPKTKSKSTTNPVRKIIHPKITSVVHLGPKAITQAEAKSLIGWAEETKQVVFKEKYDLQHNGVKIRLENNVSNRPIYGGTIATLIQEYLRGRWKFNGEPIIIGKTGQILNGQHTLISFIQAVDEWRANPEKYPLCKKEPVLEKLVVYGIDEDDTTVNTMDTCKPRSLADVIYRGPYFGKMTKSKQRIAARMADNAIRMLWSRLGQQDAFAVRRTHAESVDFLQKHESLLKAVSHILEEDSEGKVKKLLPPGYASAALYLMGTGKSDPDAYFAADTPSEKLLDFSQWDRACEYFVKLAAEDRQLFPIRSAIGKLLEEGYTGVEERWVVIAKGWNLYNKRKPIKAEDVYPEFDVVDGIKRVCERPLVGGIDVGEESHSVKATDPTPAEIKKQAAELRKSKSKEPDVNEYTTTTSKKLTKASRKGKEWAKGDVAWVRDTHESDDEAVLGTLQQPYKCQDGKMRVEVDTADGTFEYLVSQLSLTQYR